MEKELSGRYENFNVFFFYDLEQDDERKEREITNHLNILAKVFYDFCNRTFSISKYACALNINLVGDEQIRQINNDYRKKDKVTDVLSFPLQENLRGGEFDNFLEELELGDVFVCDSVCTSQAEEFKLTYIEEFLHLTVHGFLHLCGYDHEISDEEELLMEKFEEEILGDIKKARS